MWSRVWSTAALAMVPKVHHSIIDGVSGAEVMAAFFDLSPGAGPIRLFGRATVSDGARPASDGPRIRSATTAPEDPGPGGDPGGPPIRCPVRGTSGATSSAHCPGQADARWSGRCRRSVRTARSLSGRNREQSGRAAPVAVRGAPHVDQPGHLAPSPGGAGRPAAGDVRRVRQVLGGTTNDVVLAVIAGAMRAFFAARGEQLDSSLVAMVPVSVRTEEEGGALGNRVSAMLVSLATGVADPADRLRASRTGRRIGQGTELGGIELEVFAGWAQALVPAVATRLTRLVTNLRLFDHVAPLFNLIVSNVPGPDFPLYLAGARMVAMYPVGPIIEGVGVNVTVFSYLDTLYVGVQGCRNLVPDLDTIARGMEESLEELVGAADRATDRCRGGTPSCRPDRTVAGRVDADRACRRPGVAGPESGAGQLLGCEPHADVAQLVEHHLAKVRVAGSNPVVRSKEIPGQVAIVANQPDPRRASHSVGNTRFGWLAAGPLTLTFRT